MCTAVFLGAISPNAEAIQQTLWVSAATGDDFNGFGTSGEPWATTVR